MHCTDAVGPEECFPFPILGGTGCSMRGQGQRARGGIPAAAPQGVLHFAPGEGVFPGASTASDVFNAAYSRAVVAPWLQQCAPLEPAY
eukprot:7095611-Lingulodinium_polyedra.AAC.1